MADDNKDDKKGDENKGDDKNKNVNDDVAKMKIDLERFQKENSDLIKELTSNKKMLNEKLEAEKKANEKNLADQGKFKELAEAREKELNDTKAALMETRIDAALKVSAIQAGIVDIDGLKLADRSKISIDEKTNSVIGADETIKALKEGKPFLFGKTNGRSGNPTNPNQNRLGDVDYKNLTPDEIAKLPREERRKIIAELTGRDENAGKSAFTIAREAALAKK